jgi:hypothetical protein
VLGVLNIVGGGAVLLYSVMTFSHAYALLVVHRVREDPGLEPGSAAYERWRETVLEVIGPVGTTGWVAAGLSGVTGAALLVLAWRSKVRDARAARAGPGT